uniref:PITH domain-containing protein n=1 Tax=Lotharella oceanica TaxID=641309 RepID=A0A7S2TKU4_9EUKA|mmetsp:Transcript_16066/g.30497  ORF Transcript_16066/g.30497 Transcript_16066/m.30497 type:complete len:164 (+) Transcript_16066:24-515(+)|eukprot:CAMPEP_0170178302 /NCGR_PEP_ID=MMETSP0040_2-20121228/11796_1 /TAXON_ID=641309 /ORGANISM="Lotharella oceanica, Strain CCMP622" /LENGTH=163 /DNA_ID=CAMNT_0010421323 /DNA_START=23 /DNA_END=514 /DNA_ORIENTATION=-
MEEGDLSKFINAGKVVCLNGDKSTQPGSVVSGLGLLKSDTDEQMILVIPFTEKVKIRSVAITAESKGDVDGAPKVVKLFKNEQNLDFNDAEDADPTAELDLSKDDVKSGKVQKLKFTKFQSVETMTVFIESNQADEEQTFLNNITFYGVPIQGTNMSDLKKAG